MAYITLDISIPRLSYGRSLPSRRQPDLDDLICLHEEEIELPDAPTIIDLIRTLERLPGDLPICINGEGIPTCVQLVTSCTDPAFSGGLHAVIG